MTQEIITTENPNSNTALLEKSIAISYFNEKLISHVRRLQKVFSQVGGAGLAAPQIGINKRIILCSFNRDKNIQTMINPSYTPLDSSTNLQWEGCYSVPMIAAKVSRWSKIFAQYYTIDGQMIETILQESAARIFQHECDHLDGIIITSKCEELKKFNSLPELHKFLFSRANLI